MKRAQSSASAELRRLTLTQATQLLQQKKLSLVELYQALDSTVAASNEQLNIYLTPHPDDAPPEGLPVAVKDNICTAGTQTTASSLVLDRFVPQFDATVVQKLRAAGLAVYGKTNLDAWAHGSSTETSQYGRTLNPRNPEYLPGGSSGGSAAAVAADWCLAAVGTETAGSIRQPAAWCGVVGLKPTYGRVSRYGIAAMASSTDSPGPITKTVADAALLLNHLAGHDPLDGTTSPQTPPDFTHSLGASLKGLKIGLLYTELEGLESTTPHLLAAAEVLRQLGATVTPTSALDPKLAISIYTIVQRAEVASNLARYTGVRYGQDRSHFGAEAKRRIMLGTYTTSKGFADKYYDTAQRARTLFRQDFDRLFTDFDAVISLSSPGFAKKVGATQGASMFGELEDMLLEPSSITGLPGLSVPCYHDPDTNLYLGLNIMAPMWHEETIIKIGDAYEQATNWNSWRQHDQ